MTISDLVIQWLLASEIPSIRYLAYKDVLCYPAENPIVTAEFQNIQSVGPVPEILGRQIEGGQWPYAKHFYTPKYVSTHWTLMLLEELRIDPGEPRFLKAVEYMLDVTLAEVQNRIQTQNPNFICLWGNLLRYAVYAGLAGDTRVQSLITLVSNSLADTYCQCDINSNNPCSWGAARTMWGLAAVPKAFRSERVNAAIHSGLDFLLLKYSMVEANYPSPEGGKKHEIWNKISFPLFYQSDILHVLRILAELGQLGHPNAQPAIDWLKARQKADGRFKGSSPFKQRVWRGIVEKEDADRWVTLQATGVLMKAGEKN